MRRDVEWSSDGDGDLGVMGGDLEVMRESVGSDEKGCSEKLYHCFSTC